MAIITPPHFGEAAAAAIGLADLVVVPVAPGGADLLTTAETVALARRVREIL